MFLSTYKRKREGHLVLRVSSEGSGLPKFDSPEVKILMIKIFLLAIMITPFENPQRWMGQNTFPIFLLNDDNMIGEH